MERLTREVVVDLLRDARQTVQSPRRAMARGLSRLLLQHASGHAQADLRSPGSLRGHRQQGERKPFLRSRLRRIFPEADRNAEARALLLQAMEDCGNGVITLDLHVHVQSMSARAAALIARYLPNARLRRDHLPEPLDRWVRQQQCRVAAAEGRASPVTPLAIGREHQLLVHLLAGRTQHLMFLRERLNLSKPRALESRGLTRREIEVLTWIAQGKTNDEIGTILGLSRRTAEKHVEHILHKLGVENRTTAARAVITSPRRWAG
jgi:DNA-binding CsgD family transcriptional regulator